jgi:large subunit ribosomal protein L28e
MSISSDLTWLLVRNNSCFLVKNRTPTREVFTREPANLLNLNKPRYSGLINRRAVDVQPGTNNKSAVVTIKTGRVRKPNRLFARFGSRNYYNRTARNIRRILKNYRPDLRRVALARWNVISKSSRAAVIASKRTAAPAPKAN